MFGKSIEKRRMNVFNVYIIYIYSIKLLFTYYGGLLRIVFHFHYRKVLN